MAHMGVGSHLGFRAQGLGFRGFPKFGGTFFWGVRIIRSIVFKGLYWSSPV